MAKAKRPKRKRAEIVPAAPRRAERIEQYRVRYLHTGPVVMRMGYRAAAEARASGRVLASGGSGDYHLRWDYQTLRRQSQEFDRDNGLYHGLINRALDNIIGSGFRLQARTDNAKTNATIERLWAEERDGLEIRGLDDFHGIERLGLRHLLVDGDVGAIKLEDGRIQIVEAERITDGSSPGSLGIELNEVGVPTAFLVADYDQWGQIRGKSRTIGADAFIFMAHRQRISQTRGIPAQVCNFPMFHRINDVLDSEAIAWQILSRIAIIINQRDAARIGQLQTTEDQSASEADLATRYQDIGDALIFRGEPNEEVRGVEHNIPGQNFAQNITMYLRLLGLPLGFPLELVLLDWSQTTYSSARAALEQAYRMFAVWQGLLRRAWHGPIYRHWIASKVATGRLPARPDIARHEWLVPPFPWIDPKAEAESKLTMVRGGFALHSDVLKSENRDRDEFIDQRAAEIRGAIMAAKRLEAETGTPVPWQHFAGLEADTERQAPAERDSEDSGARTAGGNVQRLPIDRSDDDVEEGQTSAT